MWLSLCIKATTKPCSYADGHWEGWHRELQGHSTHSLWLVHNLKNSLLSCSEECTTCATTHCVWIRSPVISASKIQPPNPLSNLPWDILLGCQNLPVVRIVDWHLASIPTMYLPESFAAWVMGVKQGSPIICTHAVFEKGNYNNRSDFGTSGYYCLQAKS